MPGTPQGALEIIEKQLVFIAKSSRRPRADGDRRERLSGSVKRSGKKVWDKVRDIVREKVRERVREMVREMVRERVWKGEEGEAGEKARLRGKVKREG